MQHGASCVQWRGPSSVTRAQAGQWASALCCRAAWRSSGRLCLHACACGTSSHTHPLTHCPSLTSPGNDERVHASHMHACFVPHPDYYLRVSSALLHSLLVWMHALCPNASCRNASCRTPILLVRHWAWLLMMSAGVQEAG